MYPFDRFSKAAKGTLTLAQEESERQHHRYIGTEHLLLAMAQQQGATIAGEILARVGVSEAAVRARIEQLIGSGSRADVAQIIPTERTKKVIEMGFHEARAAGSNVVTTDHILLALIDEGEGIAAHVLTDLGATSDVVRSARDALLTEGVTEETEPRRLPGGSPRPLSLGRPETPTWMERAMSGARVEARLDDEDEESEAHLFRYLLRNPAPSVAAALARFGIDPLQLYDAVRPPERVRGLRRAVASAASDKRAAVSREDYPAAEAARQREKHLREELDAAEAAWRQELSADD